jgi:predicted nucleic acid-binding protein
LLVDELAARAIAQQRGLSIIGNSSSSFLFDQTFSFPKRKSLVGFIGVLIAACQQGMMSPENVRDYLKECQRQGTYYSDRIIETVYRGLVGGV